MAAGRVAVALSGGVDSAVAALLLLEAGAEVHAVHMRLWAAGVRRRPEPAAEAAAAEVAAAEVARRLDVPFSVLDLRPAFDGAVVRPFIAAYLDGLTPNPCVDCNPFRFARLRAWADEREIDGLASGHYARLERRGGRIRLCRGRDERKEQSYMLAGLPDDLIDGLSLPLGDLSKGEVRELARRAFLGVADADESQEVCFAPEGYRRFLEGRGVRPCDGRLVDEDGRELGRHKGHWLYTIGQRRGLGLGGGPARYVLERRAAANEVVVGPGERLVTFEVDVVDLDERGRSLLCPAGRSAGGGEGDASTGPASRGGRPLAVQLRSRSPAVDVLAATPTGARSARLRLAGGFQAAAPGQAAVLYRGACVAGSGTVGARRGV